MPQFFFAVVLKNERIADQEGTELPSLAAARVEAIKDARAIMSAAVLTGKDVSARQIEISDKFGEVLLSLPFALAITPE